MLKRQDSLVASAARRQTPALESHHHVIIKSTGCMSGIIQLISKYQKKTKRLTCGRKQGKNSSPTRRVVVVEHEKDHLKVARSPKIQPSRTTQENVKKEAAALLMGQEESSPPNKSTELKRRKILQALEKCNDDLESIRKIINSLKRVSQIGDAMKPSPSPLLCNFHNECIIQQRKPVGRIKRLGAYKAVDKFTNNAPSIHMKPVATMSCSKAMIQSVEEVCNETAWGKKREVGKIGLILQDHICRDLIEELVKEMDLLYLRSLPFIACRKRLFF